MATDSTEEARTQVERLRRKVLGLEKEADKLRQELANRPGTGERQMGVYEDACALWLALDKACREMHDIDTSDVE